MKRDAFDGAPVPSPLHDAPAAQQQVSGADFPLLFDLDRVCVRLGPVEALQDVSVRLRHGERVALVGANGCGKSTMLRLLNGLLQPAGGRIVRDAAARQALAVSAALHVAHHGAQQHRARPLAGWAGLGRRPKQRAACEALDRVGMASLAGRNARTLSGGQQQRLALARAWAASPRRPAAGRAHGQSGSPRQARRGDAGGGIRHRGSWPTARAKARCPWCSRATTWARSSAWPRA
jgi:ABC-type branched-subunit amino acid transport system ATPase component